MAELLARAARTYGVPPPISTSQPPPPKPSPRSGSRSLRSLSPPVKPRSAQVNSTTLTAARILTKGVASPVSQKAKTPGNKSSSQSKWKFVQDLSNPSAHMHHLLEMRKELEATEKQLKLKSFRAKVGFCYFEGCGGYLLCACSQHL
jgi:hypothetical protein